MGQHLFGWQKLYHALSAKSNIKASNVTTTILMPLYAEGILDNISHEERIRIEASKIQTEIRRSKAAAAFQRELNR